jgi:hypothetical protein
MWKLNAEMIMWKCGFGGPAAICSLSTMLQETRWPFKKLPVLAYKLADIDTVFVVRELILLKKQIQKRNPFDR